MTQMRDNHFDRLNSYRNSKEFAEYYRSIGNQVPEGGLPSLLGNRWEIDEEIYHEFLEMLPPLGWKKGSFYMMEFSFGDITTKFTKEGNKYYCEFARFPERAAEVVTPVEINKQGEEKAK
jgi:Protein of unknown function (DUF1419)